MLACVHIPPCVLTWADMVLAAAVVLSGVAVGTICNFTMQLRFLQQYDNCLDMSGLCHAWGSGVADMCVQLLDLCIACNWGHHWECVLSLLCTGVGWLLTCVRADPDGYICAGEHHVV